MTSREALHALAYSAWFVLVFVTLTWLTFPWSKIRDQAMVAAHDTGTNLQLSALDAGVFGAKVKGLSVGPLSRDGQPRAPWLTAERAKLKTWPIALLKGATEHRAIQAEGGVKLSERLQRMIAVTGKTSLDADMYDGSLSLDVEGDAKASRLQVVAKKLNLAKYPVRAGMFVADPTGSLNSKIDVVWNWQDPRKTSGAVDLEFGSLVLAGFKAGGFSLPQATFDRSEAHLKIKSGRAEFRDTSFESDVASAEVGGFITLKKRLMRSTLSLNLKFKVKPELDGLVKLAVGKNANHRDEEGWYHYQVLGNLAKPRLRPSPIGNKRGTSKPRRPLAALPENDDDDSEPQPTRSSVKDRRVRGAGGAVERPGVDDDRRRELEERRSRLREERRERRDRQREARRRKALDRAAKLDPQTVEDIEPIPPADDFERVNERDLPEDIEIEGDFNEGDGSFDNESDSDLNDGGDYQD